MKKEKFVQFAIKAPEELKEAFFNACYDNDRHASQVIRDLMKQYVAQNGQKSLKLK